MGRVDGQLQVAILYSRNQAQWPVVRPIAQNHLTVSAMAVSSANAMAGSTAAGGGNSGAPSRAAGAADANSTLLYCYFQCGGLRPKEAMRRNNERGVWMCKPCYNAKRAIEGAASKDPASKTALQRLKNESHDDWLLKVRTSRIAPDEPVGVADEKARRSAVANLVKRLVQGYGVVERQTVHWLVERRFVAYQMHNERMSEDEAKTHWQKSLADEAIQKRGSGDSVMVAVSDAPVTEGYRFRQMEVSLGQSAGVFTASAAAGALGEVVAAGANPTSLHGSVFGPMGDVLRPGAAAAPAECAGQLAIGSLSGDAPALNAVVADTEFAKAAAVQAAPSRTLQVRPSDVDGAARKRRKLAATTGVTGRLADVQLEAVDKYGALAKEFGKHAWGKKIREFYTARLRKAPPDEIAALATEYQDGVEC